MAVSKEELLVRLYIIVIYIEKSIIKHLRCPYSISAYNYIITKLGWIILPMGCRSHSIAYGLLQ